MLSLLLKMIIENDIDVYIITETWLTKDDPAVVWEMLPPGYSFINSPRDDELGGIGVLRKT